MNTYYNNLTSDDPSELLTHVDENDNVIEPITREDCHNQTYTPWHRTTHVYIMNSKGELLLTKRSALKDTAPNRIVISSGGHVKYGEDSLETAQREVYEELGLESKLKFIKKYKIEYKFEKEFVYVYFGKDDNKPEINKDEVEEVIYIPLERFLKDYDNGDIVFPPGSKDICDLLIKEKLLVSENFYN
jgi:isopentenyldiphosphate isomerase